MTPTEVFFAAVLLGIALLFPLGKRVHRRNVRATIRAVAGWRPRRDYSGERGSE